MDDPPDCHLTAFSDPSTVESRRTSFSAVAATYDAVRPSWPADTVQWMLGRPERPLSVLDVGAGTGLGTRTIAGLGHRVLALDPSAQMLAALDAAVGRLSRAGVGSEERAVADRISARVGVAESLQDDDRSYDVVTAFQAWHWVDPARAVPECARVLRPGGCLSLAWHSWADGVGWLRDLGDVVDTPEMIWRPGSRHQSPEYDGFAPPENARFGLAQRLTVADLVRLASSWSPVAVRDDRDDVLAAVRELGTRAADADGTLLFRYVTDCFRYRRT